MGGGHGKTWQAPAQVVSERGALAYCIDASLGPWVLGGAGHIANSKHIAWAALSPQALVYPNEAGCICAHACRMLTPTCVHVLLPTSSQSGIASLILLLTKWFSRYLRPRKAKQATTGAHALLIVFTSSCILPLHTFNHHWSGSGPCQIPSGLKGAIR